MLTDFDGQNTYSIVISVGKCGVDTAGSFTLYPNPSTGIFNVLFTGDKTQVSSTEIFNSIGEKIYESIGFQSTLDLSGKPAGDYFVEIHLPLETINLEVVVVK
jgi:hypothetical protein